MLLNYLISFFDHQLHIWSNTGMVETVMYCYLTGYDSFVAWHVSTNNIVFCLI